MERAQSGALIRRYYDEIANQPNLDIGSVVADEILTPEFVFHPPKDVDGQRGLARHKQSRVWHHGVTPDQQFTVDDVVVSGDQVRLDGPCAAHTGASFWDPGDKPPVQDHRR